MEGLTRVAIGAFKDMAKAERRLDELRTELNDLTCLIPDEDMEEYMKITGKIETEEQEKLDAFFRRREKRIRKEELRQLLRKQSEERQEFFRRK